MPKGYISIAGGWSYAPTRVGKVLRAPNGRQVYFQPGDDEAEFMEQVEAIGELNKHSREAVADIAFGAYFD